ncbi:MAG: hypothetical protein JSV21_04600 [Nitrospirota bacterium]|nr:MAG: hypothetical protein JSV21_04600 [Nitrospirota bacterium]
MTNVKLCPDCGAEYFAHIYQCADCGAVLLTPEENKAAQDEKQRRREQAVQDAVAIRQGDIKWMGELYNALIDAGISCTVVSDDGCNKGCCDTCYLVVSREDAEKANESVEEYLRKVHPELQESHDLTSLGKCPACGSSVGSSDVECSDCGLTLMIVEE